MIIILIADKGKSRHDCYCIMLRSLDLSKCLKILGPHLLDLWHLKCIQDLIIQVYISIHGFRKCVGVKKQVIGDWFCGCADGN